MKNVDTREYVGMLRDIMEEGHDVNMLISGSSMSPFLIHQRDWIFFRKKDRPLRRGDMVFYVRESGQYVMHRILKVHEDGTYDIVGDAQNQIEYGVREDQIFARIFAVKRKGKMLTEGSFWWWFFEVVWLRIIPLRHMIVKMYSLPGRRRRMKEKQESME